MKRVLITGGAGFIGHHVIRYFLKNTDYEIVSIDRLDFSGNLNRISDILDTEKIDNKKRLRVVFHDLRYALDGSLMKSFGWNVNKDVYTRIEEVVKWSLKNDRWLKY